MSNRQSAIVLVGFMAAGKSTVAQALARRLSYQFIDLDQLIEAREGRKIASIIDEDGEPRFRQIETEVLREVLANGPAGVIALGGGAWTIEENRKLISEHNCLTVWLDAPFELCWSRITSEGNSRPLGRDKEKARKLFEMRQDKYQHADMRIRVDDKQPIDKLLDQIQSNLPKRPPTQSN